MAHCLLLLEGNVRRVEPVGYDAGLRPHFLLYFQDTNSHAPEILKFMEKKS
jgi:hypothetical protein